MAKNPFGRHGHTLQLPWFNRRFLFITARATSLFTRITTWLADATNGIQDFYATFCTATAWRRRNSASTTCASRAKNFCE